jgi:polyphosphate kinase 2
VSKDELGRKDYEEALDAMQGALTAMAGWANRTGARVLVILEGRDTAGKTGAINAISQKLNPRQVRTVALSSPTEREKSQWYFQRYVPHLPAGGEIVLFDRSWYNRAGVEKVMGFATDAQVAAFLEAVPGFERMLVEDGILLFKYWLTCDQVEQEKRLAERHDDPGKRWKISPIDLAARGKYAAYTEAREAMLKATHSKHAPWTLVDFNDQRRGRLTLVRDLLDRLPVQTAEEAVPALPPLAEPLAKEHFGVIKPLPGYPAT